MTICHKLDVVPDLLAVHAHKPDIYPDLLAASTSGSQNSRNPVLMAYPRSLKMYIGDDGNYLQAIDIEPCQRVAGDCTGALLAALNRNESID